MKNDWVRWLPMQGYLEALHARLSQVTTGQVADYIPELALADPDWFGIALVTVDGNVYQVGDARLPFTVQSVSKAITYGIALEDNGIEAVRAKVGVEPTGEAFNSINLEAESGRPFNPMINAGAIATTGLIRGDGPDQQLERILETFARLTGHPVAIDDRVYASERDTGHRNRAIAHLLRNADILTGCPENALDVYFRQCSIAVTARDLAAMGACLANSGVNPITGVVALDRRYVEKVLSVMSTCGMYDYSGSWVFSVGMPAKSGVGGGIMAVLPGQFGLGVFSPPLDPKGNSVRGIRVCEELSSDFGLHLFKVARATSSSVLRVAYDGSAVHSRRTLQRNERDVLERHGTAIRVFALQGELMFGSTDSVIKTVLQSIDAARFVILDFARVIDVDAASAKLLADLSLRFQEQGKPLFYTGTNENFAFRRYLLARTGDFGATKLLRFADTDRALEWCEDELIREHGQTGPADAPVSLEAQYLCAGLPDEHLTRLRALCRERVFPPGDVIFQAGDPGHCFYLVVAGRVEIEVTGKGHRKKRLVTVPPGMSFGEFSMVNERTRSARAVAVTETTCYEVACSDLDEDLKARLLANLAGELARRLSREARELEVLDGRV
mgnify:FL=1